MFPPPTRHQRGVRGERSARCRRTICRKAILGIRGIKADAGIASQQQILVAAGILPRRTADVTASVRGLQQARIALATQQTRLNELRKVAGIGDRASSNGQLLGHFTSFRATTRRVGTPANGGRTPATRSSSTSANSSRTTASHNTSTIGTLSHKKPPTTYAKKTLFFGSC